MLRDPPLRLSGLLALALALLSACAGGPGVEAIPDTGVITTASGGPLVRFLVPDEARRGSASQFFSLTGFWLGDLVQIEVTRNQQVVGTIEEGPLFELPPTPLEPGVNRFVLRGITASGDEVRDELTLVYNEDGLIPVAQVAPEFVELGAAASLFFTVDLSETAVLDDAVELWRADVDGSPLGVVGNMRDDGNLSLFGDAVAGDGVYSARFDTSFDAVGTSRFLITVYAMREGQYVPRHSNALSVTAVEPVPQASCAAHVTRLGELRARFEVLRQELLFDPARAALVEEARDDEQLLDAGSGELSEAAWVRFDDGLLGIVPLARYAPAGQAPAAIDYAATTWSSDKVISNRAASLVGEHLALEDVITRDTCPSLAARSLDASETRLPHEWVRELEGGLVYMQAEGALAFGGLSDEVAEGYELQPGEEQPVLLLPHDDLCASLDPPADPSCTYDPAHPARSRRCDGYGKGCVIQDEREDGVLIGTCMDRRNLDLRLGRLVLTPDGYGLTPRYLAHYLPEADGAVALLDVPRSGYNGQLAAVFLARGYGLVVARLGRGGEAPFAPLMEALLDQVGATPEEHPELRLFGSTRIGYTTFGLSNGTFEAGSLDGWRVEGDARQVSSFADDLPVEGKGMGLISTGLGMATGAGAIEQIFCPPPGSNTVRFYWRVYSEEFQEWCGYDEYDDELRVIATVAGQSSQVLDASISRLCPPDAGNCGGCPNPDPTNCACGALYEEDLAVVPGLVFDEGDVWRTAWRESSFNVSAFAGERPVLLRFEVRDRGDSELDTAALIDRVTID